MHLGSLLRCFPLSLCPPILGLRLLDSADELPFTLEELKDILRDANVNSIRIDFSATAADNHVNRWWDPTTGDEMLITSGGQFGDYDSLLDE